MNNKLKKIQDESLPSKFIEDKKDLRSLMMAILKNVLGQIPIYGAGVGALADYYYAKVTKKREQEVNLCIDKINKRIDGLEIKQAAIDYVEKSLVFRLEELTLKLITNPDKGFDEVIADFVASALTDLDTPPAKKDLILSTLLNLDSIDLKVLKTLDSHFVSNLDKSKTNRGVTRDSLYTLLKDSGLDTIVISRSIQRLQSQYLIQPLNTSTASIQEVPNADELYNGKRSPQFDSPGGFVNTDFGRDFMNFLKISSKMKGEVGI